VIRSAQTADADAITRIYNHYIEHSTATFAEEPVTAAEIVRRIERVLADGLPWLVAEDAGQVVGYTYATKWRERTAYRFSVECTVYLDPERKGRGVGSQLYQELLSVLRARGVHSVIGGIALPNDESIALHEKFGFQKTAHFKEVGFKFGRWVDVAYWQRLL